MDITLDEFITHQTAFICTNIQETDLAGHAEDVARYAERLQVVDRNLALLVETMQPDDCLVRAPPPQNGRSFLSSLRFAGDTL